MRYLKFLFCRLNSHCPKNYNPSDYYIYLLSIHPENEVASKNAIKTFCDSFENSEIGMKILKEVNEVNYDYFLF